MMHKDPDERAPTAAAVVELLAPWCDAMATQHLAEQYPPASGILQRGPSRQLTPPPALLAETAEYVLDDYEPMPSPTESPSQISQGTVPISADSEDTHSHDRHTAPSVPEAERAETNGHSWFWFGIAAAVLTVAFLVALVSMLI
jgi:hypothetical protein